LREAPRHDALRRLRGGALSPVPLFGAYRSALAVAPITTNVISAASLSLFADTIAQSVERAVDGSAKQSVWDWARSAWIVVWGGGVSGYALYFWFQLLARLFPHAAISTAQLISKVAVNQLVLSPALNAGFFSFIVITRVPPVLSLNAAKRALLWQKLQVDLPQTIRRACYYWGVVQTVNFRLIPLEYNTLWTNGCFLIWTTYLSWVGFKRLDCQSPSR